MKVKTSVTLEETTVRALDRVAEGGSNRSRLVEQAVLEFLHRRERMARDARELERLNRAARRLNREMADVLRDQVEA